MPPALVPALGKEFPYAGVIWIAFFTTLGAAPYIKPLGISLDVSRGSHPLQMPFAAKKWTTHTHYAIHWFRMAIGPISALGSLYAGYLGKYSGSLDELPELHRFAANLVFPMGVLNTVQHIQMFYERLLSGNQLWDSPIIPVCIGFQSTYAALLLRWTHLTLEAGVTNSNRIALGAYFHVSGIVLTNIIRAYFFAKNGFSFDKMTENFIQPTCPVMKKKA